MILWLLEVTVQLPTGPAPHCYVQKCGAHFGELSVVRERRLSRREIFISTLYVAMLDGDLRRCGTYTVKENERGQ